MCLSSVEKSYSQNYSILYNIEDNINIDKLKYQLEFLCSDLTEGRASGSRGANITAMWLCKKFQDMGLKSLSGTYNKNFIIDSAKIGRNIIGLLPSSSTNDKGYILVIANYDGLGIINKQLYPSADNNASGIVALLALANISNKLLQGGIKIKNNIIFATLDGKRNNQAGTRSLINKLIQRELYNPTTSKAIKLSDIKLVVNLEQLGSNLSPISKNKDDYLIMLGKESIQKQYQDYLDIYNIASDIRLDIAYSYYGNSNFSKLFYNKIGEQSIFVERKIPAVMFTSGITMNNNKVDDNVKNIDLALLRKRILLISKWLERMCKINYN